MNRFSVFFIKLAIFLSAFFYLKSNINFNFRFIYDEILVADYKYLFISFVIYSIVFILSIYRWFTLLQLFISKGKYFSKLIKSSLKGLFVSNFMFGAMAGDAVRVHDQLSYTNITYKKSIAIALTDRAYTLMCYVLTICISFLVIDEPLNKVVKIYSLLITFSIIFLIIIAIFLNHFYFKKSKFQFLNRVTHFKIIGKVILFSVAISLLMAFCFILIGRSIGCIITPSEFFRVQIGLLSNFVPFSFSGWGVREVAMVSLLQGGNQCGEPKILMSSIIYGAYGVILSIPGFYYYFKATPKRI